MIKKLIVVFLLAIVIGVPSIGWYMFKNMPIEHLVTCSVEKDGICIWFLKNFRGSVEDLDQLTLNGGFNFIFAGYNGAISSQTQNISLYDQRTETLADFFLNKGLDINAASPIDGLTPLHSAVVLNQPEVVKYLLSHGADKSVRDNKFKLTAVELANKLQNNSSQDMEYSQVIQALQTAN
jgi:hypothetical protein